MQQTFAKETSKKELQFFRIINLQKIKVMLETAQIALMS